MTLWDTQAHAKAYAASDLYQGFRVKTRDFLAGSTEWKVQLSPDLTLETVHDVEEPVVKSYAIEQFEDGKTVASDSAQLYVRIVALKVNHGKMDEFRNVFADIILPSLRHVKGCRYAFLTEGDSEDEVLSVTIWRSVADATAYEASGMVEQFLDKLADTFSGLYQWKMGLDKEQRDTLVTTEDVKVSHYEVITGETFRGF
jgi:quinol monooxygenase YgiN